MRRLFQSFEETGLEYLLISGQATVLYGAAMFSEDVDIWIRPTTPNAQRLLRALAACDARVHKLTPPVTLEHLRAGHGFHFVVPEVPLETYLDVMGRPPRVGSFASAKRRARLLETEWGKLPVVHPVDLVELKKTRRLADYDIITTLVWIYLKEQRRPAKSELRWAADNSFRIEERTAILKRLGKRVVADQCSRNIAMEVSELQLSDREYWGDVIDQLRQMRRDRTLLLEGQPVAELLGRR